MLLTTIWEVREGSNPRCIRKGIRGKTSAKLLMRIALLWRPRTGSSWNESLQYVLHNGLQSVCSLPLQEQLYNSTTGSWPHDCSDQLQLNCDIISNVDRWVWKTATASIITHLLSSLASPQFAHQCQSILCPSVRPSTAPKLSGQINELEIFNLPSGPWYPDGHPHLCLKVLRIAVT